MESEFILLIKSHKSMMRFFLISVRDTSIEIESIRNPRNSAKVDGSKVDFLGCITNPSDPNVSHIVLMFCLHFSYNKLDVNISSN